MLESLRQNSRSMIIWILFGIIIATFVLTFGTQSDVNTSCSGPPDSQVMTVSGEPVSVHSWRLGMNSSQSGMSRLFWAQQVLDRLLEREILAQAAEEAGFRVTTDMASDKIKNGEFYIMGSRGQGNSFYFRDGYFDYEILRAQVNAWGLPNIDQFISQQQRELQANMMRQLILESAQASPEEARARYVHENTKVALDVVQFRSTEYRRKINLTPADIDKYLAEHEAEVRKKYQDEERTYKGVGKQVQIRQIMFRRQQPAAGAGQADPAAGAAADPAAGSDPGEAAARDALAKLQAGTDFAELAAQVSEDERSKRKGGDLGWKSLESPGLGATELAEALKKLQPGQISDVIATPRGYYILKVEGAREGDLGFDQVKREIAEKMAPEQLARDAARRDATAALERAKAAVAEGKRLEDVFERMAAPPPQLDMQNLPEDMSPEQLQQILQQLQQQQGSVTVESDNMPAEVVLQDEQQGTAAPAAGTPAAPAAATPAAPAAQTTAQPAGTDAAATTAAPAGAGSEGQVPVPDALAEARVRRVGPFTRSADGLVPEVGKSEELVDLAFDKLTDHQLVDRVLEVSDTFVIAQLVSRQDPNLQELEKDLEKEVEELARERGYRLYSDWIKERCKALVNAGDVTVNVDLMAQLAGTEETFTYRPFCAIEETK